MTDVLGYRKAIVIALPLLLAGCGAGSGSGGAAEEDTARGDDWIMVEEGEATPSPTVKRGTASPTPSQTLPPLPARSGPPAATPSPTCTPVQSIAGIEGLAVVPRSTTAVVTWYHPGGGDIVDYRVTAMSQDLEAGAQQEVGWTRAAPAKCGEVSATVTGLEPGTPYIFSVDVVKTRAGVDGTITETIARSQVVSTT